MCKLCGRNQRLVRAHIIPESMYPFEDGPRKPLVKIPSTPGIPRKRSSAGEYDPDLVCAGCEAIFSPWDDYAYRLLNEEPKNEDYFYAGNDIGGYVIHRFDYSKLKLFFVSLLWRAAESERPFFQHARLGATHTAQLKEMIQNEDPGNPDDYAVFCVG